MSKKHIPLTLLATACSLDPQVDERHEGLLSKRECVEEGFGSSGCMVALKHAIERTDGTIEAWDPNTGKIQKQSTQKDGKIGLDEFGTFQPEEEAQGAHREKRYDEARAEHPGWTRTLTVAEGLEQAATEWGLSKLSNYATKTGFTRFDINQDGYLGLEDDTNGDNWITREDLPQK